MSWQDYVQRIVLLLFALVIATGAEIKGPVDVPAQHTVKLELTGAPEKTKPKWVIRPLDGQDAKEIEWISDTRGTSIRWIAPVGRYEVSVKWAWITDGIVDFDDVVVVVNVGKAPGPGPGPTDPEFAKLVAALQDGFNRCAEPDKAAIKERFASLWRGGAANLRKVKYASWAALWQDVEAVAVSMQVSKKVAPLQGAVQTFYWNLGFSKEPRTDASAIPDQENVAKAFDYVARAMDQVK